MFVFKRFGYFQPETLIQKTYTQNMKKLITVCWSATVEIEVPDSINASELVEADFNSSDEIQKIAINVIKDAYCNIGERDGIITDIQDSENERPDLTDEEKWALSTI